MSASRDFLSTGAPAGNPLQPPGGGGTVDGMEARVASLEAHLEYVRRDIAELKSSSSVLRGDASELKVGLATLTERVRHLPGKGFIVTSVVSLATLVSAIVAARN